MRLGLCFTKLHQLSGVDRPIPSSAPVSPGFESLSFIKGFVEEGRTIRNFGHGIFIFPCRLTKRGNK
ncbi:hypothetical protein P5673_019442 [Acropora cervicornis]|uniref:Uncharacterized protein n=1 Tax=Acropora cervicornis TaxID=6130 RepID=A0AAD9QBS4_ACRCE|nr:hypothetical protein P5673_019442 [Acropora cervicornis]